MLKLYLKYPAIAKEKLIISEVGIPFAVSSNGIFKLILTCYAEVEEGRTFELLVVYDKYDEIPLYKLIYIYGEAILGCLEGQEEFFKYLAKLIPIDKYIVGRRNSIHIVYKVDKVVHLVDNIKMMKDALRANIPLTRGIMGWMNYIHFHPGIDIISVLKNIKVKFECKSQDSS